MYLEVVPRTFAIRVKTGLALNQLRLLRGPARLDDDDLWALNEQHPLLYDDAARPLDPAGAVSEGLYLSIDLSGGENRVVGYRAKKNSKAIDLSKIRHYRWNEFWEPVFPEPKSRIMLEPEDFYLLLSHEGVSIPPTTAAEMMAYDPTAGELRTHYAGFFDPGFGYDPKGKRNGSRAALEVRARDVAFMVEHGQPLCKLSFERMTRKPDVIYGTDLGSNYQGQSTMLSKHFETQTAGMSQMDLVPSDGEEPSSLGAAQG